MVMRKRKVNVREVDGMFVVDYRDHSNKRHRAKFRTIEAAEYHAAGVSYTLEMERNGKKVPTVSVQAPPPVEALSKKSIKEAIKFYCETCLDETKEHFRRTEKWHFGKFFVFMVNDQKLRTIDEVDLKSLDRFRADLRKKKGFQAATINRMFATYSPFFDKCLAWGLIAKSPIDGIKKLEEEVPQIKKWTPQQKAELIEKIPGWAKECLYFMAHLGCRPIDVRRANWGHIDDERRTIEFTSRKGGRIYTASSPIPDIIWAFLSTKRETERRKFRARPEDPIFTMARGQRMSVNALGRIVREFRGVHGDITPYGLRHAFIDALVDMNVHSRDIQILARHRKFETTTRYTHRSNEHLAEVVNRLSNAQDLKMGG